MDGGGREHGGRASINRMSLPFSFNSYFKGVPLAFWPWTLDEIVFEIEVEVFHLPLEEPGTRGCSGTFTDASKPLVPAYVQRAQAWRKMRWGGAIAIGLVISYG
jgi:hypothetical protein